MFLDIHVILLCLFTNPVCDSALPFADQVHIHFHFGYSLCMFCFSYVHDSFKYSLFSLLDVTIASFY